MTPKSLKHLSRSALCILLAACLCCGCTDPAASEPPASSAAGPAGQTQLYDSSILDDGELRILSDLDSGIGSTVFCGSEVLYQGSSSETLSLVTDQLTGSADYYWRCWSDPEVPGSRFSALYDKTGSQLFSFDEDLSAERFGQFLVMRCVPLYEGIYDDHSSCRVIELSTGRELPVPENAYSCIILGERLVFCRYDRPDGLEAGSYDEDTYYHTSVLVTDLDGTLLLELPHCVATGQYYDDSIDSRWVHLETFEPNYQRVASILYDPVTGEQLTNFEQTCGDGLVCISTENGYQVIDLADPAHPVLGTFDLPVQFFAPGLAVLWHSADAEFYYELHDLDSGEVHHLLDYTASDDHIAVYLPDATLRMYDRHTGEQLFSTSLEGMDTKSTYMYFEANELLRVSSYEPPYTCRYYTTAGTVTQLEQAFETYNAIYPLTIAEDGTAYYWARRAAPGGSGSLFDVLDGQGNVYIRSLASCYSINDPQLPPGVFITRKGFYYGWMDVTGQWVYCRSIFSSLNAEDNSMYFF